MVDRRSLMLRAGAAGLAGLLPLPAWSATFANAGAIQALIDQWVAARRLPGAVVSLGIGGAVDYIMGGTLAFDSEVKVDENSLWRMASNTKPIAGVATMILVAEGLVALDQPLADFVPAFADMTVMDPSTGNTRPAAGLITIRHLLTHTSGLPSPTGAIAAEYTRLGLRNGSTTSGDAMPAARNREEWANRIAMAPLVADPGTKWIYSSSLDLAARVIEVVSGLPFDRFLDERIFIPASMRSTFFQVPETDWNRLVTYYRQQDGELVVADPGPTSSRLAPPAMMPSASGGLVSSARDYDRFLELVMNYGSLDGTQVIPEQAVRLATSNLLPPGTEMSDYNASAGTDAYGAGGAAGTTGFVNPIARSRVATFTNIGLSDFGRSVMALADQLPA